MITAEMALDDLRSYVLSKGFLLSDAAQSIFRSAEETAERLNVDLYYEVYLLALIECFPPLRSLILRHGASPEDAVDGLREHITSGYRDAYTAESLYSRDDGYRGACRHSVVDGVMDVARRHRREEILGSDVLEGLLDVHDEESPAIENYQWTDERLHVPFNTLSHIKGWYQGDLWIAFDDIRRELALFCQRRLNFDPPWTENAEVKLTHPRPCY